MEAERPYVMVVDDERDTTDSMCDLIEHRFPVATLRAHSVDEARRLLDAVDGRVALVLADHVMPNGTGLEFLEEVRRLYPHVRCVLMTALFQIPEDAGRVAQFRVYPKPMDAEVILDEVAEALDAA